jgi:hypothetical protein
LFIANNGLTISEHFEERVMVRVPPNIVEIIVLPTSANALLGVASAPERRELSAGIDGPEEDWLELAHARIDKQQRWVVVRNHTRTWPMRMIAVFEKLHKRTANPRSIPLNIIAFAYSEATHSFGHLLHPSRRTCKRSPGKQHLMQLSKRPRRGSGASRTTICPFTAPRTEGRAIS